jgi:hypothetical protein
VTGPAETAARRYRAVIAKITEGMDAEAEQNKDRVLELRGRVAELGRELARAADRVLLVRIVAELAWEEVLEALWVESWMTMRPFPRPDRMVKPGDAVELGAEIERHRDELLIAVHGRRAAR